MSPSLSTREIFVKLMRGSSYLPVSASASCDRFVSYIRHVPINARPSFLLFLFHFLSLLSTKSCYMPVLAADNPFRLGDDPLTYALEPPPNETVEEKNAREAKEAEAKRVSDLIDESIKNDKAAMKKEKEVVKVLLLGQSESGKYDWVVPYLIETS